MEPFHVVNSGLHANWLANIDLPVAVCSVAEIEHLAQVDNAGVDELLVEGLEDPERQGWSVHSLLQGHASRRSPVLDAAWATYSWSGRASSERVDA